MSDTLCRWTQLPADGACWHISACGCQVIPEEAAPVFTPEQVAMARRINNRLSLLTMCVAVALTANALTFLACLAGWVS